MKMYADQLLTPSEQISVDFATYNNKNMLVVKDRVSGLVWAKLSKDQTTDEAFMAIVEWCHKYGIPHSVRSDGRGSFRSRSIEKLKEMRVEHTHTSLRQMMDVNGPSDPSNTA